MKKVALVTGSSRGIGRGIAELLRENGYQVVYSGTRQERPRDLPEDRDGALNGKIDLLVRKGEKVFVLDWKTNSLPDYGEASVNGKMDEEGYHLQYKIYSLAASEWLKPRGLKLGGVAYLFVRGGEVGERSGVFAQEYDAPSLDAFRDEISKMGYFVGRKEAE